MICYIALLATTLLLTISCSDGSDRETAQVATSAPTTTVAQPTHTLIQVPPTPTPTIGRPIPTVLSTSTPPYRGTLWIRNSSEIINESDPTLFDTLTKISDNPRKMYDHRNGWITVTPFLFEATFTDGQIIEVQVNPEFESVEIAREIALMYVGTIGRLPTVLL